MMYDVKEKQAHLKAYLRKLRSQINNDEIEGMAVIVFKKDKTLERFQFDGEVTVIEWVGTLEAIKTYFLTYLLTKGPY
jgi:hypothetical protein